MRNVSLFIKKWDHYPYMEVCFLNFEILNTTKQYLKQSHNPAPRGYGLNHQFEEYEFWNESTYIFHSKFRSSART